MDSLTAFTSTHKVQITSLVLLVTYALLRKKFTPGGTLAGVVVCTTHMLHPWPAFYWLLIFFVLFGILVTRIGKKAKAHLTHSSHGGSGGEETRGATQVYANSGFACILIVLHIWLMQGFSAPWISSFNILGATSPKAPYLPVLEQLLPIGIIAQYAAVAADTFSSELGILAATSPVLITAPWKTVPKGTNGGVTLEGLMFGALGSFLLTIVAILALHLSGQAVDERTAAFITFMGLVGTVLDSLLGALAQATVADRKTGKVVEGPGGQRVRVDAKGSREIVAGWDLLTNNGVNFAMASLTSVMAMAGAWAMGWTLNGK